MRLNKFLKMTAVLAVVFAFTACDEDFTEVGGEIINNPSNVELREVEVNAYSQKINSVQTNNLNSYFLGTIKHPVFGESTSSIVTQLSLSRPDPEFGENVQLDSVVMTIPYFSREVESADSEQDITYELDSVYGDGSFNLKIYETGFYLNELDPDTDFEQSQKYYSDQQDVVEQNIIGEPIYVDENFEPSAESFITYELGNTGENDTITHTPAFRVKLPVDFFQQKIIDKAGSEELIDNNNFKNYLRSLFIKAESNGSNDLQVLFDWSNQDSKISLYYTSEVENAEGETERKRGVFDLNMFAGSHFNTYTGDFPSDVDQEIQSQSSETGAENLYLKAQEGSMAVIELFPDAEVLQNLKDEELLINEADLTFYVNDNFNSNELQPRRLYLYDLTNNSYIIDYALDGTYTPSNPELSMTTFSQPVKTGEDENGSFYTLRITTHVSSIINDDSENVKLGLVIVPNINSVVTRGQQGITGSVMSATKGGSGIIEQVPSASLLSPTGTVLHGNLSDNEDKRLKLKIYYTNYN